MLSLAKDCIDVGLYTNDVDGSLAFFRDEVGLPYEELLKVGGGVHQHRLGLRGSVLKVNASREPLAQSWSPYRSFKIADPTASVARSMRSPDDVPVTVVPAGSNGVTAIEIVYAVANGDAQRRFLGEVLEADEFDTGRFRLGTTVLSVEESPIAPPARTSPMRARGFQYMTIQVHDCNAEHERAVKLGATDAMSPRVLGTTARISFIRDPAGGWIELSQRANLVGHLD